MKKITAFLIFLMFSFPAILLSQEKEKETSTSLSNNITINNVSSLCVDSQEEEPETSYPSYDTDIIRNVSSLDVEGIVYNNVTVSFYSNSSSKVIVKILNVDGRVAWKKTFKNSYLYLFSTGAIHVGKPKFTKILIR